METVVAQNLNVVEEPEYIKMDLVIDSGAADHVADTREAPGYEVTPSQGSRQGECWKTASGDLIPNRGEMILDLQSGNSSITSTFQVGALSRPLWSVSKLCDAGCTVTFDSKKAVVVHQASGGQMTEFPRRGALYACDMLLRNPRNSGAKVQSPGPDSKCKDAPSNAGVRTSSFQRQGR